ncbi:MAG: PLxRFG domain-containing protein [Betaproteobacteria bacterium]|nr:PLxRFG domain-containing protein [Betaproteobacteria bacterium]
MASVLQMVAERTPHLQGKSDEEVLAYLSRASGRPITDIAESVGYQLTDPSLLANAARSYGAGASRFSRDYLGTSGSWGDAWQAKADVGAAFDPREQKSLDDVDLSWEGMKNLATVAQVAGAKTLPYLAEIAGVTLATGGLGSKAALARAAGQAASTGAIRNAVGRAALGTTSRESPAVLRRAKDIVEARSHAGKQIPMIEAMARAQAEIGVGRLARGAIPVTSIPSSYGILKGEQEEADSDVSDNQLLGLAALHGLGNIVGMEGLVARGFRPTRGLMGASRLGNVGRAALGTGLGESGAEIYQTMLELMAGGRSLSAALDLSDPEVRRAYRDAGVLGGMLGAGFGAPAGLRRVASQAKIDAAWKDAFRRDHNFPSAAQASPVLSPELLGQEAAAPPHIAPHVTIDDARIARNLELEAAPQANPQDWVDVPIDRSQEYNRAVDAGETTLSYEDWNKAQLQSFLTGDPVATIEKGVAPRGGFAAVRAWAIKLFESQGGKATHPELGDVALDGRSVRDSLGHNISEAKSDAFAAVKDVIEKGRWVAHEQRKDMDSYYVTAPIQRSGRTNFVTALVHKDVNTQRMYLHSVTTKEGLLRKGLPEPKPSLKRPGKKPGGDVTSILRDALNFKADTESAPPGTLPARTGASTEQAQPTTGRNLSIAQPVIAETAAESETTPPAISEAALAPVVNPTPVKTKERSLSPAGQAIINEANGSLAAELITPKAAKSVISLATQGKVSTANTVLQKAKQDKAHRDAAAREVAKAEAEAKAKKMAVEDAALLKSADEAKKLVDSALKSTNKNAVDSPLGEIVATKAIDHALIAGKTAVARLDKAISRHPQDSKQARALQKARDNLNERVATLQRRYDEAWADTQKMPYAKKSNKLHDEKNPGEKQPDRVYQDFGDDGITFIKTKNTWDVPKPTWPTAKPREAWKPVTEAEILGDELARADRQLDSLDYGIKKDPDGSLREKTQAIKKQLLDKRAALSPADREAADNAYDKSRSDQSERVKERIYKTDHEYNYDNIVQFSETDKAKVDKAQAEARVADARASLEKYLGKAVVDRLINSGQLELLTAVPEEIASKRDGAVTGMFHDGKITLFLDNIARGKEMVELAHEAFHAAMHSLSEKSRGDWNKLMERLVRTARLDKAWVRKALEAIPARDRNSDGSLGVRGAEELGAYALSRHMDKKLTHLGLRKWAQDMLDFVARTIREFLGLKQDAPLTPKELESIAIKHLMDMANGTVRLPVDTMTFAETLVMLKKLGNTPMTNKATGIVAEVNSTQARKLVSNEAVQKSEANGFSRAQHYAAAAHIRTLWENATLDGTFPDEDGQPHVRSVKRFSTPFTTREGARVAHMVVKETLPRRKLGVTNRIYSVELASIEKVSDDTRTWIARPPHTQSGSTPGAPRAVGRLVENQDAESRTAKPPRTTLYPQTQGMLGKDGKSATLDAPLPRASDTKNIIDKTPANIKDADLAQRIDKAIEDSSKRVKEVDDLIEDNRRFSEALTDRANKNWKTKPRNRTEKLAAKLPYKQGKQFMVFADTVKNWVGKLAVALPNTTTLIEWMNDLGMKSGEAVKTALGNADAKRNEVLRRHEKLLAKSQKISPTKDGKNPVWDVILQISQLQEAPENFGGVFENQPVVESELFKFPRDKKTGEEKQTARTPEQQRQVREMLAAWKALDDEQKKLVKDLFAESANTSEEIATLVEAEFAERLVEMEAANATRLEDRRKQLAKRKKGKLLSQEEQDAELAKEEAALKKDLEKKKEKFDKVVSDLRKSSKFPYYVPHNRVGEYVVVGKSEAYLTAEQALKEAQESGDAETLKDLQKKFDKMKTDPEHYLMRRTDSYRDAQQTARDWQETIAETDVFPAIELINRTGELPFEGALNLLDTVKEFDVKGTTKNALTRLLVDAYASNLTLAAARKARAQRTGKHGLTGHDLLAAYAATAQTDASYIAELSFGQRTQEVFREFKKEAMAAGERRDTRMRLYNEVIKRVEKSFEETHKLTSFALSYNAVTSLMFKPAYYVQNFTQPWMMTLPYLSLKHDSVKIAKMMVTAYGEVFSSVKDVEGIREKLHEFGRAEGLPEDVQLLIEELSNRNMININVLHDVTTFRINKPPKTAVGRSAQAALRVGTDIMAKSELLNRAVSAIVAYRAELARLEAVMEGKAKPIGNEAIPATKEEARQTAIDYAAQVITMTQGDYSTFNTPRWISGSGALRVIMQFKKFPMIQMTFYLHLAHKAIFRSNRTNAERIAARKALGFSLGMLQLGAGVLGLPGADWIGRIFAYMFGDDDDPMTKEDVRKHLIEATGNEWGADLIMRGVPSLAGLDMSSMIGAGDMTPFLTRDEVKISDREGLSKTLLNYGGPSVGKILGFGDAYEALEKGDVAKAISRVAPQPFAGYARARVRGRDGLERGQGKQRVEYYSAKDYHFGYMLATTLGFQTMKDNLAYEAMGNARDREDTWKRETARLKRQYKMAYEVRDFRTLQSLRDQWRYLQDAKAKHGATRSDIKYLTNPK